MGNKSPNRKEIKLIENNPRTKDYTFDYSKQPSQAMLKYRKCFSLNDSERYCQGSKENPLYNA